MSATDLRFVRPLATTRFRLWLNWTLLTTLAFCLSLYWIEIDTRPYLGVIEGAIGGAVMGGAQWLLLRHRLSHAWQWWLATTIGWSLMGFSSIGPLGWIAPRGAYALSMRVFYGVINGAQMGLWLGLVQWAVLKQQVRQAWRWVIGSIIGWSTGLAIGWALGAVFYQATQLFLSEVIGLIVGWVAIASITGLMLVQLWQVRCQQD